MSEARIDPGAVPAAVHALATRLRAAGGRVWLVGGPVRDLLLGLPVRDHDLATDLVPERVAAVLPEGETRDRRFGVVHVPSDAGPVSITTLRRDLGASDQRHPDEVVFVDRLEVDAGRRDFTVNALYADLTSGRVEDPVQGMVDLQARLLRTVGEPGRRFAEDALRLLRAIRFAARCGLTIEPATFAALQAAAPAVATVSAERQFAELTRAFTGPGRARALALLVSSGLANVLLPEVAAMAGVTQPPEYHPEGCVLTHTGLVLEHVPEEDPVLAWSAVLHDVGKPPTWRQAEDRIRFDGHDVLGAEMADTILRRLHASNAFREAVVDVCRHHIRFASLPQMRPVRAERWMRSAAFPKHLAFHRADCLGSHGDLRLFHDAERRLAELPPERPPLLQGADVLALGVSPGPEVGRLLRAVEAAAEEAPTAWGRAEALALLRELVGQSRQEPDGSTR